MKHLVITSFLNKYMKHLIVLLLLFVNLLVNGQSIDNLENNNGFKIFKLNSPLSSWNNNLRLIENRGGFSTYEYINSYSADKTVFSLFDNDKSESCIYFEDRIFDGTILWKSNSVVLQIYHDAEMIINNDGSMNLKVDKSFSFEDKSYYESNKMNGF